MTSTTFIPHHLFVSAAGQPARGQRKPNRDLLDPVPMEDQAMAVSFEFLESDKESPLMAQPLRVFPQAS